VSIARNDPPLLLTPVRRQHRRDLIATRFLLATGHRLRPGLRREGVDDAEAIRQELRRREWGTGR
jgi:hypothetical protein